MKVINSFEIYILIVKKETTRDYNKIIIVKILVV